MAMDCTRRWGMVGYGGAKAGNECKIAAYVNECDCQTWRDRFVVGGMPWNIVERRIGRAGGEKQRTGRQREWDRIHGADGWAIGYVIEGEFVLQEEALESVYDP